MHRGEIITFEQLPDWVSQTCTCMYMYSYINICRCICLCSDLPQSLAHQSSHKAIRRHTLYEMPY